MTAHATLGPGTRAVVRPPAGRVRLRLRHRLLLFSFCLLVAAPIWTIGWYLYTRAQDQYASNLGFSVRTEESGSAIELLGGVTQLSGSSSSDTDILFAYLTSQELIRRIDDEVDLREIWSRDRFPLDPVFTLAPGGTIEDLRDHWLRKVTIVYDNSTGMIDLRILAFDPFDAQRIAEALFAACTEMINELSAVAREDAIKYARDDLEQALTRLRGARQALTEYRNRNQIVDPGIDTASRMGLLTTLQGQQAEALIELDLLLEATRDNDPRVVQAKKRVRVIEARITAERRKLGLGDDGSAGTAFADLVGEYEGLIVDREFAEVAYTTGLAAYDAARAEAQRQSRYLAAHVRPTLAEAPEYPEREVILALATLFALAFWVIAVLVVYSLRDRR